MSEIATPRVLVVESAGNLWGSERVLLDMLAGMPGPEIAVCCPPGTPIVGELQRLGIRVCGTFVERLHEKTKWARLRALFGVLRACAAHRPKVIYLNQAGCYRIARVAARLFGVPLVVHVRIYDDAEYLARVQPDPRELKGVVAISRAIADEIAKYPTLRGLTVHTIYDGYAAPAAPTPPETPRAPARIACVGRMVPIKGQDVLLEALAWCRAQGRPIRCAMVGSGDGYWEELKRKSTALGLDDLVEWTGFQRDPLQYLREVSVLAVPSHREPLGRVVFEAWDSGCVPVAWAESGGAAEAIAASGGGLLYPKQTAEELGRAIERALALSVDARSGLVRRGRAWLSEQCAPARYAASMRAVFAQAVG